MYFAPTILMTQLLAVIQVLMTIDMSLSTTMALPVTSKPIESTVENLAWQAWIDLPPEQKQQVKSRKVTPKSIFTLPNRIDCPEGHKQVDTKCIPIVIGTNANLISVNYLALIAGSSPTDEQYDYDDVEEVQFSFNPEMQIGEAEESVDGLPVELKPPSKDEPLKFNIFENKFNIYHEEPFEDYLSSLSNEASSGVPSSYEKESSLTLANKSSISTLNTTAINDFGSEPSNVSENNSGVTNSADSITTQLYTNLAESNTMPTVSSDNTDFKVNAISLPASGFEIKKPNKLSMFQNDPSVQLITSLMDTGAENQNENEQQLQQQQQEHDIQTLLQTDSLLPLIHPATATTLLSSPLPESSSFTAAATDDLNVSSSNSFILNIENAEEMTTAPNIMDQEMQARGEKVEYTRSVTFNPLISDDGNTDIDQDDVNETTLKSFINDEPLDTTTPIQSDDTTIMENIETSTSLFAYSSPADSVDLSTQQDLKELLIKQEQAIKEFEELQRMRKGDKDQHAVLKKSKVEPVEVLSTTTATTDMPATTTKATTMDELITAETVTPLLTVHNENDNNNNNNNNDRFYYQHFTKQDLEETLPTTSTKQRTSGELTTLATAMKMTDIEAKPAAKTSEIDLAEELRLINELVKGITPAKTTTNFKTKMSTTTPTTLTDVRSSSSSPAPNFSESSAATIKPTLSTSQIWSKIMPLLTRPQQPKSLLSTPSTIEETSRSSAESSTGNFESSTTGVASASNRSNRNSKIIRINGFNSFPLPSSTATSTTTTTTEEPSPPSTTITPTAESYWWLPVAWRLDKTATTEKVHDTTEVKPDEQPLLLRFWSAYHAPKSS